MIESPLLVVKNLSVAFSKPGWFRSEPVPVVRGVSFEGGQRHNVGERFGKGRRSNEEGRRRDERDITCIRNGIVSLNGYHGTLLINWFFR